MLVIVIIFTLQRYFKSLFVPYTQDLTLFGRSVSYKSAFTKYYYLTGRHLNVTMTLELTRSQYYYHLYSLIRSSQHQDYYYNMHHINVGLNNIGILSYIWCTYILESSHSEGCSHNIATRTQHMSTKIHTTFFTTHLHTINNDTKSR